MAQKLGNDKILGLSYAANVITLGSGSVLTIGGQQYTLSANVTLTVPTLIANTLYMLYAVVSSGVVSLVQSTNFNSVGPANQSAWKLVGAYYSNGPGTAFGAFIAIEGVPTSDSITWTPSSSWSTNVTHLGLYHRVGHLLYYRIRINITGTPSGNLTSAQIMPTGYTIDTTRLLATVNVSTPLMMNMVIKAAGGFTVSGQGEYLTSTTITISTAPGGTITPTNPGTFVNGDTVELIGFAPVTGWDNKPLRDL